VAYKEGKSSKTLHTVRDTLDYYKEREITCIASAFDQAKVFDRIDHGFVFHVFEKFDVILSLIR
jgi:hypothetical protein